MGRERKSSNTLVLLLFSPTYCFIAVSFHEKTPQPKSFSEAHGRSHCFWRRVIVFRRVRGTTYLSQRSQCRSKGRLPRCSREKATPLP